MKVRRFTAAFTVDGQVIRFRNIPLEAGKHTSKGFSLRIKDEGFPAFSFGRTNGKPFELKSVVYDIALPLTNAGKIIVPDTGRHFVDTLYPRQVMFKRTYLVSGAHMASPFFVYMDNVEAVTFAFGLMGKIIDTAFEQTSPGANKKYSLVVRANQCRWRIHKPYHPDADLGKMSIVEDGFYQHEGDKTWFHALRRYAEMFQKHHKVKIRVNERMYKPQLCTWRVVSSDRLTHKWSVATARKCREMGIGMLILDDGWYGVGLDSDIMISTMGDWPRSIKGKFPDITKTVRQIRAQGVHPVLWYCPTGVGVHSKLLEEAKDYCVVTEGKLFQTPGLFYTLCPRNPKARKIMKKTLQKVLSYGADGFKPDLFNYMPTTPCEADHEHDIPTALEATRVCFKMMDEIARKHDPQIIYSAKNDEANVDFCQYAAAVRSGDSPYDPNIMFLRCAYPNAFAKIIINDYLMLAGPEEPKQIAHCMIKQVTMGVPALSVDLLTMAKSRKQVLKAWIGLYNNELMAIHKAARIEPQDAAMTCWERIDEKRGVGVISVVHPGQVIHRLPQTGRLFVLNATEADELFVRDNEWTAPAVVRCFDHRCMQVDEYAWTDRRTLAVPSAGYCEIRAS